MGSLHYSWDVLYMWGPPRSEALLYDHASTVIIDQLVCSLLTKHLATSRNLIREAREYLRHWWQCGDDLCLWFPPTYGLCDHNIAPQVKAKWKVLIQVQYAPSREMSKHCHGPDAQWRVNLCIAQEWLESRMMWALAALLSWKSHAPQHK